MLGSRNPKEEIRWERFELPMICASPMGSVIENMPALYTLKESVLERGYHVSLSNNLLISANLLSTFLGETNCLLTENQKQVHRGLLIREEKGPKLVLVSENDAYYLKQHLINAKVRGVFLVEPSGAINQRSSQEDQVGNVWKDGDIEERSLLLQALIFQGSALLLDQLPIKEVKETMNHWARGQRDLIQGLRILFEGALDLRPEDMLHYRRSQKLRKLFS